MTPAEWILGFRHLQGYVLGLQGEKRTMISAPLTTCEAYLRLLSDGRRGPKGRSGIVDSIKDTLYRVENRAMGYLCALRAFGATNEQLQTVQDAVGALINGVDCLNSDTIETTGTTISV